MSYASDLPPLPELDLFAGFSRKEKREFNSWLTRTECAPGEMMLKEGTMSEGLYLIQEGTVEIRKETSFGPVTIAELMPPALCGETGLLTQRACTATAVAKSQVVAGFLPVLRFDLFLSRRNPTAQKFAVNIGRIVSERLRVTTNLLIDATEQAFKDCEQTGREAVTRQLQRLQVGFNDLRKRENTIRLRNISVR